jgi:hypothetical protein
LGRSGEVRASHRDVAPVDVVASGIGDAAPVKTQLQEVDKEERTMLHPYKWCLAVVLGLAAVAMMSAPVSAGNVTDCGDFRGSPDTRFDLVNSISTTGGGACLLFADNVAVFLNGFVVVGPGLDSGATGMVVGNNSFVWGPGIVRGFSTCLAGGNDVAVETILFNQCGTGVFIRNGYKIKEVRVHDCTPSALNGVGIFLGQGGFIESSIVRACDVGVFTGQNNKIWNLVVTRHTFAGLVVGAGNAVSRTVISHPRSTSTIGLDYTNCGTTNQGCEDASNSVSGHNATPFGACAGGLNVCLGGAFVVTQSSDIASNSATNCNGTGVGKRDPTTGHFLVGC